MPIQSLRRGECPNCCGFLWRPGPRRGVSQNIECVGCGRRFNVSYVPDVPGIMWVEELPSETEGGGEWRTDMFPKVLQ